MMSFTDENLKLIKMQMYDPDQTKQFHWTEEKLKALIARLEAAELIAQANCEVHCGQWPGREDDHLNACDKWRKTAGK